MQGIGTTAWSTLTDPTPLPPLLLCAHLCGSNLSPSSRVSFLPVTLGARLSFVVGCPVPRGVLTRCWPPHPSCDNNRGPQNHPQLRASAGKLPLLLKSSTAHHRCKDNQASPPREAAQPRHPRLEDTSMCVPLRLGWA